MNNLMEHVAIFFWTTVAIDGERWYSASLADSDSPKFLYFGPSPVLYKTNHLQQGSHRPQQLKKVNPNDQTKWNDWNFMTISDSTTSIPVSSDLNYNKLSKFKLSKFQNNKQYPKYETIPPIESVLSEYMSNIDDTKNSQHPPTVFKFNNTIHNINVIKTKKPKPKRRVVRKRCPTTTRPRQKKQLNLNQTAQQRFLEVFEVVEFDHVPCTSSSGLEGICLPQNECLAFGGTPMGTCADGYGTCCVTQFSCDGRSAAQSGWFTNPGFPAPSTERLSCTVTIDKASEDIRQIRLDFMNLELLPPNVGTCEQDQFVVSGQNVNNIIPILCGVNTGQHIYIEVADTDGPITLSVQTVSSETRLFSIKVSQLTSTDDLAAPTGCLQYHKGQQGYLESFNYRDKSDIVIARSPSYLNNLNYAMCIERAKSSCSVTYTNAGIMQIVNYDSDGLPVIPPGQAGVETFNCPTDWLLIAAIRLCGERLNDGSVLQDFALDAPVTDDAAGPIIVWFRSDGGYIGRGFKFQYLQNDC